MGTADNIIIGAPSVITIGGVDIGFTQDGLTLRFEREYVDVPADQAVGVVKKARSIEKMFIATTLLEITLNNLRIAWDQPPSNLSGGSATLILGYDNSCDVNEHAIVITGIGTSCGTRTVTLHRCVSINESEYPMSREEASSISIEFECLKDPSNSNNFGQIVDS